MTLSTFTVRFCECDQYGIVNHSNYFDWMSECRIDLVEKAGFSFNFIEKYKFVIARASVTCRKPCRIRDVITVETKIARVTKRMVLFIYKGFHADSSVAFEGETENFVVDAHGKSMVMNDEDFEIFKKLEVLK